MGRSKLKTALKAEKGVDIKMLKEKRRLKERTKVKAKRTGSHGGAKKTLKSDHQQEQEEEGDEEDDDEDDEDAEGGAVVANGEDDENSEIDGSEDEEDGLTLNVAALDESSDDSSVDFEKKIERPKKPKQTKTSDAPPTPKTGRRTAGAEEEEEEDDDDDEDEDDEDEEIDWADLPPEEREDLVPRTRISINNTAGLLNTLKRFAVATDDGVPFASHQSLASPRDAAEAIGEDLMDDVKRELAFYAQALDAAKRGRALLRAEGVPFARPTDYFAEMVKDDGHMEKVKAKLVEEASAKKASAEARKLRDLKKFGKQVQVAKLQERQKAKRETLDKIKNLKRKRSETGGADLGTREADLFDVGVDDELDKHNRSQRGGGERGAKPGAKRQKKNEKFGFGGKKKYSKSGDATSSADLSGFSAKRMKSGAKGKTPKTARLGKSRRKAGAGKR
ncbi:putative rRNA processing protein [Rosellinia necatrix]|uniref:Putative rRNA processing protein n=1 Tax=Rosellinia necatrix TaxID=77044 RepID=A0A1W2TLG0_ROSNE|nr:putative rRNA processing protein [Rosellinia necatrix]